MRDARTGNDRPSPMARAVATHAVASYFDAVVSTLADLVGFRTVAEPGVPNARHPEFLRLKGYLARKAAELGLEFEDHGAAVLLGLGESNDRLGLITHADVRPAQEAAWAADPFSLDTRSEPGRLLGRGVEDDKGPIAAALYSMKALRDQEAPTLRRVELIISMTEESDWTPFREFLTHWEPPQLNIVLDAVYPVVTAERGSGAVVVTVPAEVDPPHDSDNDACLVALRGGRFPTQIPAEAEAVVTGAGPDLTAALRSRADRLTDVTFDIRTTRDTLRIHARGVAAHSATPWEGCNAITHLAALLGVHSWPPTPAATMLRFINDLIGTSHYADRFGAVAYAHDFMGPLTLALTTLDAADGGGLVAGLNIRRPVGRSRGEVDAAIRATLDGWSHRTGSRLDYTLDIGDPYYLESAPHIPVLIDIFRFYTGRDAAGPLSIGGGTQARLVPNGLNFGPAMPDEAYTGHSEHEFMTVGRLRLALQMYTAALVELASG